MDAASYRCESMPTPTAIAAMTRCMLHTNRLLAGGVLRRPSTHVGRRLRFADGSTAGIYRETRVMGREPAEPAVLIVGFTLRVVHTARAHAVFRTESLLNTMFFAGFPGFESKLWLRHDERGRYRGLYQWDGSDEAEYYVAALHHVLGPVSRTGSIDHKVLPGRRRDELLRHPEEPVNSARGWPPAWWRVVDVRPPWP
jgi:hypothetical protein